MHSPATVTASQNVHSKSVETLMPLIVPCETEEGSLRVLSPVRGTFKSAPDMFEPVIIRPSIAPEFVTSSRKTRNEISVASGFLYAKPRRRFE